MKYTKEQLEEIKDEMELDDVILEDDSETSEKVDIYTGWAEGCDRSVATLGLCNVELKNENGDISRVELKLFLSRAYVEMYEFEDEDFIPYAEALQELVKNIIKEKVYVSEGSILKAPEFFKDFGYTAFVCLQWYDIDDDDMSCIVLMGIYEEEYQEALTCDEETLDEFIDYLSCQDACLQANRRRYKFK